MTEVHHGKGKTRPSQAQPIQAALAVVRRVARKNQANSDRSEKPPAESNTAPTSPLGSAVRPTIEDEQATIARTAATANQRLLVRVAGRCERYAP